MFDPWFKKPAHPLSPPLYRCSLRGCCAVQLPGVDVNTRHSWNRQNSSQLPMIHGIWTTGCFGRTLKKSVSCVRKDLPSPECKLVCARPSRSLFWCHTIQITEAKSDRRRCADTCKPISLWHEKTRTCGRLVLFDAEEKKKKAGSASRG